MSAQHPKVRLSLYAALLLMLLFTAPVGAASNGRVYVPMVITNDQAVTTPSYPGPVVPAPPTLSPEEQEVVSLTNELRRAAGCGDLVVSDALEQAAKVHSADMASHNAMQHQGSDGSMPWDRAARFGYTGAIGENIAAGYSSPSDVVDGWRTSAPHYTNMTNCSYQHIGLALATSSSGTRYWTQLFGQQ